MMYICNDVFYVKCNSRSSTHISSLDSTTSFNFCFILLNLSSYVSSDKQLSVYNFPNLKMASEFLIKNE